MITMIGMIHIKEGTKGNVDNLLKKNIQMITVIISTMRDVIFDPLMR
jgi:hypothetical protein